MIPISCKYVPEKCGTCNKQVSEGFILEDEDVETLFDKDFWKKIKRKTIEKGKKRKKATEIILVENDLMRKVKKMKASHIFKEILNLHEQIYCGNCCWNHRLLKNLKKRIEDITQVEETWVELHSPSEMKQIEGKNSKYWDKVSEALAKEQKVENSFREYRKQGMSPYEAMDKVAKDLGMTIEEVEEWI